MYCIETRNLTHRFSNQNKVLKNINLQIPVGSVYGFLGPNGAGKTTTLRLLLGLLKKQEGEISVFDLPLASNRAEILKKTGSLIESPSLYGHLTAIENLTLLQKIYQCHPKRVNEVLETVGLQNTGNKKAREFSLGMKQRLSIAIALLHQPSLLILDEPTNGLDPNGIIEMRELLKKLNQEQKMTIVISSHLLSEIEKVATHIGIINAGEILFQGTLAELNLKQSLLSNTYIETNDNEKAAAIISSTGMKLTRMEGRLVLAATDKEIIANLNKELVKQGIKVYQVTTVKDDLESIFIDLIKN